LTPLLRRNQPLFRPQFLGDAYQTIDFLVELVGIPDSLGLVPYFFVQARATSRGYTRGQGHLKVQVSATAMRRLMWYPAPTYILGIDEPGERGYIFAATTTGPKQLSSLPTRFPLDGLTLHALYDEVLAFWQAAGVTFSSSRFA
jgi:hypothetical protein